ncbi:MAG: carbon storage regulator [Actinomycetota bacterium]|nr:carbon storage regulator [Actinomycetota bacterium]
MLVLTRRAGESIVIGNDVRVVVLDVRGDTVRLGIEAPRSVQVHRAEVYAEVQAANAAAASSIDDLGALASRLHRLAKPPGRRPRPARRAGTGTGDTPPPPSPEPPSPELPSPEPPSPVSPGRPAGPGPAAPEPARPKPGPPPPRRV